MTSELVCRRCASPVEIDDIRCPICHHATPSVMPCDLPQTRVEVLRCSGCGVAVSYSVSARAPKCAFCGSVVQLESPGDPLEQSDHFLPFTVDRETAAAAYRSWLAGLGWFRPSDLKSRSSVESLRPLWWVGWVFDSKALVSWTADSDSGAERAEWAPHSGQAELEFDDIVVSASRGLSGRESTHLAESYDLSSARETPNETVPDAVVERFDLQRSSARSTVTAAVERLAARRILDNHIPGTRFRRTHVSVLHRRLSTRRTSFPAWVLAYRYRDRTYRTVISGQDPSCILGNAPISALKIAVTIGAAALLAIAAGGCLVLLGLFN